MPLRLQRSRLPLLLVILTAALALRVWGIAWGLYDANVSVRPHPDEWTVYWLLKWFDTYDSPSPCPNPGTGLGHQCFFDWGTAFPYSAWVARLLMSPGLSLLHMSDWGRLADMSFIRTVLAARLLSALLSTLTVYVVYRIALREYGAIAGLAAAACAAISCLLIQLGHFGTPDSTTGLWVSLTILAALRARLDPSMATFVMAGSAWGLAVSSEYHMALLAVPIGTAWLLADVRRLRFLLAVASAALAAFALMNLYAIVDFRWWLDAMEHTLRIRTVDSAAEYGNRWSVYGSPWLYVIRYSLGYGVGVPLTVWMVAGTAWALARRTKSDLVLLAWLLPYFVLVSLSPAKFMRYSAPLLPVLAVFAGRLLADALRTPRLLLKLSLALLATASVAYSVIYDAAYDGLFAGPEPRYVAAVWIARHTEAGTAVAYEQLPNGLINMPYFGTQHGTSPCFTQFQPAQLAAGQRFLVLDSYDLEEHPRFTDAQVARFRRALAHSARYRKVAVFQRIPSVLGLSFPLGASPHDWRYPDHVIAIYQALGKPAHPPARPQCYRSLRAATDALYPTQGNT